MIVAASSFSCGDQRLRLGISARTSDQFSKAWRSAGFQRDRFMFNARVTWATETSRIRAESPLNSRAMRRLTRSARLRVENASHGPSAAKADVEKATLVAPLEVVPFPVCGAERAPSTAVDSPRAG